MPESPQRTRSFTAKALAPMRRRVRALRRMLGATVSEATAFRTDGPSVQDRLTSEIFSPIETDA